MSEKKKILGVSGSPRKSSTLRALEIALGEAQHRYDDRVETELVSLHGKKLAPCNHCNYCKRNDSLCVIDDAMTELYEKIAEADSFLFASPVYAMNITPQMHAFFTRMRPLHKVKGGALRNKLAGGIAVGGTRNGGQEQTINAIINACLTRGMIYVGGEPGDYSGAMVWSKDNGPEGVEQDEEGLDALLCMGARIAEVTLMCDGNGPTETKPDEDGQ